MREDGVQAWAHSLPSAPLSGASFLHGSRGKAWWSAWQGPGRREQRWLGVPLPHSGPWTSPGKPLTGIGHRGTLPECGDQPRLPGSPPRPGGVARAAILEWGEEKAQQRASVAERTRGRTGRPGTCPNLPLPPREGTCLPHHLRVSSGRPGGMVSIKCRQTHKALHMVPNKSRRSPWHR